MNEYQLTRIEDLDVVDGDESMIWTWRSHWHWHRKRWTRWQVLSIAISVAIVFIVVVGFMLFHFCLSRDVQSTRQSELLNLFILFASSGNTENLTTVATCILQLSSIRLGNSQIQTIHLETLPSREIHETVVPIGYRPRLPECQ